MCPLAVLGTAYTVINDSFRYKPPNSAMLHSGGRAHPRGLHLSCLMVTTTLATASLPHYTCPGLRTRSVVLFEQQLNNVFRYNGCFLGTTALVLLCSTGLAPECSSQGFCQLVVVGEATVVRQQSFRVPKPRNTSVLCVVIVITFRYTTNKSDTQPVPWNTGPPDLVWFTLRSLPAPARGLRSV